MRSSFRKIADSNRLTSFVLALVLCLQSSVQMAISAPNDGLSMFSQIPIAQAPPTALENSVKPKAKQIGPRKLIEPVVTFSENPSDTEFYRTHILPERLVPMSSPPSTGEGKALAMALLQYRNDKDKEDISPLTEFVERFPSSRWAPVVNLNIGLLAFRYGYLTDALAAYEKSWNGSKSEKGRSQEAVAVEAGAKLAQMDSRLGKLDDLEHVLKELSTRNNLGTSRLKVENARESLAVMKHVPAVSFKCGPYAVQSLLQLKNGTTSSGTETFVSASSSPKGTNLEQVKDLANSVGLEMQVAKRERGAAVIVPAVMHWKQGHFTALLTEHNGRFDLKDPTFDFDGRINLGMKALEQESDGYFLVRKGNLPDGWHAVEKTEAETIWGKGLSTTRDEGKTCPNPKSGGGAGAGDGGCSACSGMPVASVYTMNCTHNITDTPVSYSPPIGQSMNMSANYNYMGEENYGSGAGFGPFWTFNWGSFLTTGEPYNNVTIRVSGGGLEGFQNFGGGYAPDLMSQAFAGSPGGGIYTRTLPDGTVQYYALSDGTNIYMTSVADPQGNETIIGHDANYRVTTITDPCGNPATTVSYETNTVGQSGFYCIKSITDGFGRTASFGYDQYFQQLLSITDAVGNVSTFAYSTSDTSLITSMTTPYGQTTFNFSQTTGYSPYEARTMVVGYPDGTSSVTQNYIIETKDTYYWDREAMSLYPTDYQNNNYQHCKRTHYLYEPNSNSESPVPAYEQNVLEGMTAYTYAGQPDVYSIGAINKPSTVTRMLTGNRVINAAVFQQGGTLQSGDYTQLIFDDPGLSGGTESVIHNTVQGETYITIATALANAVNADSKLKALGITARTYPGTVILQSLSPNATKFYQYCKYDDPNGPGERISLLPNPNLATIATIGGTITSGDTVTLNFLDGGLPNSQASVTANVTGTSTLATIASNLAAQINANTNLQTAGIGVVYTSGSTSFTVNSASAYTTSYSASFSTGATETLGLNANAQIWQYQYNSIGNVTQSIDPIGRTFTYTYAGNNIDLEEIQETKGGDAFVLGYWTYTNSAWPHQPTTYQDGSGQLWQYAYNSFAQRTTATDPNNNITTSSYNSNGYLTKVDGPLPGSLDVTNYTFYGYGPVHTVTDSEGYVLTYLYDNLNRQTSVVYPDGTAENTIYNKLDAILKSDRIGRWTQQQYDAMDQLVVSVDPLGRKTQYGWCPCGGISSLTDPANNQTIWNHDLQGRVSQKIYANGTTQSLIYEPFLGRLLTRTDALAQVTTYKYNADNTLASRAYTNAKHPIGPTSYVYDQNFFRISSVSNSSDWGSITYQYNPYITNPSSPPITGGGRLASMTSDNGTYASSKVTYTFDSLGRASNTAISGTTSSSTLSYDALSRIVGETNELGSFVYNYVDNKSGSSKGTKRLSNINYPNGQITNFSYYNNVGDQRLLQISNLNSSAASLSQFNYRYDSAGQIKQWAQIQNNVSSFNSLNYDAAGQLTSFQTGNGSPGTSSINQSYYEYDSASNRTGSQTNAVQRGRLTGTIKSGDVISVVVNDPALSGSTTTVSYTVKSTDTLATVAAGLAETITANSQLQAIGVNAVSSASFLLIQSNSPNITTYSSNITVGGTEVLTFGATKNFFEQISVGGTKTTGDVITFSVHDLALSGGSESVSYTVLGSDTLTSIATGVKTAINADTKLSALGVTATSASAVVTVTSNSNNATTYSESTNATATEIVSLNLNQNGPYLLAVSGAVTVADKLSVTVFDPSLSGGSEALSYTTKTGNTPTSIATSLASAINADANLKNLGVTATSASVIVTISSNSPNLTQFRQSLNNGATEVLTAPVPSNGIQTAAIGGTITVGDVISITVVDAGLTAGSEQVSYTVVTGDTTTTIATKLATALNADSKLSAIGVTATSLATDINLLSKSFNATTYVKSTSAGATETVLLSPSIGTTAYFCNNVNALTATMAGGPVLFQGVTNKAIKGAEVGPPVINLYASAEAATTYSSTSTGAETIAFGTTNDAHATGTLSGAVASGNVISLKVINSGLSGGTVTVSYTAKTGDTLYSIADGLSLAVNTNSALQLIGASANAGADSFLASTESFLGTTALVSGANTVGVSTTDGGNKTATNSFAIGVNSSAAQAFTYDANGNLATGPGATYAFDPENRLISVTFSNQNETSYSLDALGNCAMITQSTNGSVNSRKLYVWNGDERIQERNATGTVTKDYYAYGETRSGSNYFYTRDHLGSVREMTNATAIVQAQYSYDPFGRASQIQGLLSCDKQFTGVYFDATTNLNLMANRAYAPSQARFISRDPNLEGSGTNLYAYTGQNPISFIDRSGLDYNGFNGFAHYLQNNGEPVSIPLPYIDTSKIHWATLQKIQLAKTVATDNKSCEPVSITGINYEFTDLTGYTASIGNLLLDFDGNVCADCSGSVRLRGYLRGEKDEYECLSGGLRRARRCFMIVASTSGGTDAPVRA